MTSSSISRKNILYCYLIVFTTLIIVFFYRQLDLPPGLSSGHNILILFSIFDLFLFELLVLLVVGQVLLSMGRVFRLIFYGLCSLFIIIYCLQAASVYFGNEMLSPLAIDNRDHLYLLLNENTIFLAVLVLLICMAGPVFAEMAGSRKQTADSSLSIVTLFLCVAAVLFYTSSFWLPTTIINTRNQLLSRSYMDHTGPVISFSSTLFAQNASNSYFGSDGKLSKEDQRELQKFGFPYDPAKSYPLIKETIYSGPPPFSLKPLPKSAQPNVIIFFAEGMSARTIGVYGSKYSDLTPNIDGFARSSMIVRRYYNHTAATYRGLLGQLCSLYPAHGGMAGWQTNFSDVFGTKYLSLADLFTRKGYETIFLDAHHKEHRSRVDEMVEGLGFSTVVTGDALAQRHLEQATPLMEKAYSDRQYFISVIGYLKHRRADGNDKPFFMSLYNFGTHSFLPSSRDGVRYGQSGNSVLNNIKNLDDAFGRLVDYIQSSPYSENTVIVFTADHSHYYDDGFVSAFKGPDYQKVFVDTIPLIIHDPLRQLPDDFDAKNSSSIDFAPSLAHYFGLENARNPFMGTSIFDPDRKIYDTVSLAALGDREVFLMDGERIHSLTEAGKYRAQLEIIENYFSIVKKLERSDRIWDE